MRKIKIARLATAALAASLVLGGALVAPPALAAETQATLPTQLSTTTGSTLVRSLSVDSEGRISYTLGAGLFRSSTRIIVYIDGGYAGETYAGTAYYSIAESARRETTVKPTRKATAGQRVDVMLAEGAPGEAHAQADERTLASTVADEVSNVSLDADGKLAVTMSERVFASTTRTMIWVDGVYAAETYAGSAYYSAKAISNGAVTITTARTVAPGQKIEVGVVAGEPGTASSPEASRMVATVYATTAPKLLVDQESSKLLLAARGDAEADRVRENRQMRHSVHEPTGRYVTAGQTLRITLPAGSVGVEAVIGQYGSYAALNGGSSVDVKRTPLNPGTNTIVADRDGLVSLAKSSGAPEAVTVTGGVPVPTFTRGQTTVDDFALQDTLFADAPFVVVQGERVFAVLQRSIASANFDAISDERVLSWDHVVTTTDTNYGLSIAENGLHRKSPARVMITNPDSGGGYASATHDRITFQTDTGAAADLLRQPITDQWGLWHEIGHTYQAPQYRWDGLGEVTVNISSVAVQLSLGQPNRLESESSKRAVATYLAKPDAERSFDAESDLFVKLAMFDGLRGKFGDSFYPTLNREYRERQQAGLVLTDDESRRQLFMTVAGDVAQADLTAYFAAWGLAPNDATRASLAAYPVK